MNIIKKDVEVAYDRAISILEEIVDGLVDQNIDHLENNIKEGMVFSSATVGEIIGQQKARRMFRRMLNKNIKKLRGDKVSFLNEIIDSYEPDYPY